MCQSGSASLLKRHSPWPGLGCSRTQHFSIGVSPTGELTVPRKLLCDGSAIRLVPKSLRDPVVSSELKHTWPQAQSSPRPLYTHKGLKTLQRMKDVQPPHPDPSACFYSRSAKRGFCDGLRMWPKPVAQTGKPQSQGNWLVEPWAGVPSGG